MSARAFKESKSNDQLMRLRLDERLQPLRTIKNAAAIPRGGWLRAIRQALSMSLDDVANRLAITRSSVARIESSEQRESIQLDTLRRAAQAIDCELVYALIPRVPLTQAMEEQRLKMAQLLNAKVSTHMFLEGQETKGPGLEQWREDRAVALVSDKKMWKLTK
jgi:predicted DNA-binding mobile mystery protein A